MSAPTPAQDGDGFTPGPWEARCFLVMGGARMSDRICHVGTSTSLGPPRSNESEANARLIAAAPDMVEALRVARDAVLESFEYVKTRDDQLLADARLAQIDAALSKALGGARV